VVDLLFLGIVKTSDLCASKHQLKVQFLTNISHIHNPVSFYLVDTVAQCSHIGGVIIEAAVGLTNDQWYLLLGYEDAYRTIVLNRNFLFYQFLDQTLEHRIVE
jgi:hypothetical protein